MGKWSVASASVAVVLLLASVSGQQPAGGSYVPDEILVQYSRATSAIQRNGILAARGATRLRRFSHLDSEHVRLPPGVTVEAAVAAFQRIPGVVSAQPNYIRRVIQNGPPPDDPSWLDGSLWGLDKIQASSAWTNFTVGNGSVIVANIDTGIEYTHPDLAANMWRNPLETPGNGIDDDGNGYVDDVYGIDTANHDSDPMDDQGHGTHTAGTAAAVGNNGIGVTGVVWNAKLLACKFLNAGGEGTDAGAIECFNYIVALRSRGENIRVSSNSWGALRGAAPPAAALVAAIDAAGEIGIVNVFGAGNDGTDNDVSPFDPASYDSPSIVAVASSGRTDRRSFFSNFGATSVDLAAPGEDILSTYIGGGYAAISGTSMATPHVAGAVALLATMDPTLPTAALKTLLLDNVDTSSRWNGRVLSGGRLNVYQAAVAVGPGSGNTPPSVTITGPAEGATFKEPATIAVDATASDEDGSIQRVSFYANGAPIGTVLASPYTVVWNNAAAGNYTLTAVATDDQGAIAVSAGVHIVVQPNTPPSVTITYPAEGTVFTSPVTVTMTADAADTDGTVAAVAFFADGVLLGADTAAPFGLTWDAPMGSHVLTAVATDDKGATTTSSAVHITVDPIPGRINLALAANGGTATASSTLSANYPASGATNGDRKGLNWGAGGGWNDGTQNASPDWIEVAFNGLKLIEEVNVFSMQDNYGAPIEPTPTLTFTAYGLRAFEVQYWTGTDWAALPGGVVTNNTLVWRQIVFAAVTTSKIRVFVTGALNGYSRVMEVEAWGIGAGGNAAPEVAIASPIEGAAFTAPAAITVNATATDSDGNIQQVDFYANGSPIGTASASPFSITWSGVAVGSYTLTAVATDNQGATTTSEEVHISVTAANTPPSVSIVSPSEGAVFVAPASVTVTAGANDADGSIAAVAFFSNGAPVGTATTSPYSITLNNVPAGSYTLTAMATDNQGATTTSAAVHVTVAPVPGRMNVALAANGAIATASSTYNANYPAAAAGTTAPRTRPLTGSKSPSMARRRSTRSTSSRCRTPTTRHSSRRRR